MLDINECKTFYKRRENDSHFHVCRFEKQNKTKTNKRYSEVYMGILHTYLTVRKGLSAGLSD